MTERVRDLTQARVAPRAIAKHRRDAIRVLGVVWDKRAVPRKTGKDQRVSSGAHMTPILGLEGGSVDAAVMERNPDRDAGKRAVELRVGMPVETRYFPSDEVSANRSHVGPFCKPIDPALYRDSPRDDASREEAISPHVVVRWGEFCDSRRKSRAVVTWQSRPDMSGHAEVR